MSVINTNITSMIGQQNLQKSQNALQTSMERLSSGLRINSAKDDAAGQAIANRMTAQITGLNQAARNANDGISVAQTAEGALNQINDNLQRIRELSVQAQNGTNSQNDLQSIQDEIDQRLSEIDRISEQTDFNGVKVLSKDNALKIQVGANDNEVIEVGLQQIDSSTLFTGTTGFNVNGFALGTATNYNALETADAAHFGEELNLAADPTVNAIEGIPAGGAAALGDLKVDADGNYFAVVTGATDTSENGTYSVSLSYTRDEDGVITEVTATLASKVEGEKTTNPLAALDSALNKVDSLRSELGAVQNRFEDAITNLQTNSTNLSAARSRIEDADYAEEVANMTRAQILQQAGTSVLAQANQIPQNVLSLLG